MYAMMLGLDPIPNIISTPRPKPLILFSQHLHLFPQIFAMMLGLDPIPNIISMSWGSSDDTPAGEAALAKLAARGVTLIASTGDSGPFKNAGSGGPFCGLPMRPHVPAASEWVTAVGALAFARKKPGAKPVITVATAAVGSGITGGGGFGDLGAAGPAPAWQVRGRWGVLACEGGAWVRPLCVTPAPAVGSSHPMGEPALRGVKMHTATLDNTRHSDFESEFKYTGAGRHQIHQISPQRRTVAASTRPALRQLVWSHRVWRGRDQPGGGRRRRDRFNRRMRLRCATGAALRAGCCARLHLPWHACAWIDSFETAFQKHAACA